MIISFILHENNFEDSRFRLIFTIITYCSCLIPFIMSIIRQIQGITRFECINECIRNKKKADILSDKNINAFRKYTTCTKDDPSLASDPFEWLESHVMEYFMTHYRYEVLTKQ